MAMVRGRRHRRAMYAPNPTTRRTMTRSGPPYLLGDSVGLGSITSVIGGIIGGVVGGPAGAAAGTTIGSQVNFGNGSTDAQRQARVNWMLNAAQQGSKLAAAIIIAGPQNVASHETAMWQQALSQIPQSVLSAAYAQYPSGYWPTGAPFDMPTQRAQIVQELAALGVPTSGVVSPTTGTPTGAPVTIPRPVTTLPVVTSTAAYNWVPYVALAALGVLVLPKVLGGSSGRRR